MSVPILHVGTLPAGEAARVIFRFGLWPAALELWSIAPNDPRAKQWENARWKDGQLILPGLAPLPLPAIAAKAHAIFRGPALVRPLLRLRILVRVFFDSPPTLGDLHSRWDR